MSHQGTAAHSVDPDQAGCYGGSLLKKRCADTSGVTKLARDGSDSPPPEPTTSYEIDSAPPAGGCGDAKGSNTGAQEIASLDSSMQVNPAWQANAKVEVDEGWRTRFRRWRELLRDDYRIDDLEAAARYDRHDEDDALAVRCLCHVVRSFVAMGGGELWRMRSGFEG